METALRRHKGETKMTVPAKKPPAYVARLTGKQIAALRRFNAEGAKDAMSRLHGGGHGTLLTSAESDFYCACMDIAGTGRFAY